MRVRDVRFLYTLLIVINVNFELRIFALSSSLMGGLFKPRTGEMRRFVLVIYERKCPKFAYFVDACKRGGTISTFESPLHFINYSSIFTLRSRIVHAFNKCDDSRILPPHPAGRAYPSPCEFRRDSENYWVQSGLFL